ncbi:cytochrome P450 9e2 [Tribolium castaneum]|uniref:Cytochrome P450-like protein n=1 Tax=Tribolium castaneum TaxID=7070 RepID=D6WWU2_TRICA|nr:PREDICTED: cytochrome P450 9e2 [Tribolium castaneum]EFA09240.1 cytochrome P450-like protein [Tribolium castaneum]|eukprot:XP_975385.1 PREDICTED: cytochrome P450 9e2 [Tribolium castaneum]
MFWILIVIAAIIAISYHQLRRYHKYWSEKGVQQGDPLPLFGHCLGTTLQKQSLSEFIQMSYNVAPDARYCGIYQFYSPILIVRDPELIKQITVKDFDHFVNRMAFIPEDCDPLWGKNLVALTDQRWRDMRSTLSPAFTSSKMKYMFSLISESAEQFAQYFANQDQDLITIEMKDIFTRFTNDVIANTAFGVKIDSLEERNNEFYLMGIEATDFRGFWRNMKIVIYFIFPTLFKSLGWRFFSKNVADFFVKLVRDNIAKREKHGIVRPDLINLFLEARKNGLKYEEQEHALDTGFATAEESEIGKNGMVRQTLTDVDIAAQALLFFFGGFDSVSSMMCFMSYELALNPDVQAKLLREVDETFESCDGKLTYEALIKMKYLDMVVSETLRLWPTNVSADRVCTKPYTIEPKNPNEKALHLEKNTNVIVPIFGIHRDAKNFPEPNRFDPERFSDENKANIRPYTYLPFGAGPRNCIGSRFALLETKALFFHLLSKFEITPVEQTQIPIQLNRKSFNMTAENGFWLGLKRRKNDN